MLQRIQTTLCLLSICLFFTFTNKVLADSPPVPVKLGIIVPLTGPLAFFGKDYMRAYELVKESTPEVASLIEVKWEDSAYDTKQAVAAFNKLVSIDKADAIVTFGGPMLHALAPLAEQRSIPFFATESEKSDCKGRKFCSLLRNEQDEWGHATWRVLRKHGKKKIGIVKNQNQFMDTFVNAIIKTKAVDESVTILIDVPPDRSDLRADILALRTADIDALGVFLLPTSHHGFLPAALRLNESLPFLFGVEEFLVSENNVGFESLVNNAIVLTPASQREYRERFESRFGKSAGFFYTPAFYDFFHLLRDTVKSSPGLRGLDLVRALRFKGTREGVSGRYTVKVSSDGVYSYSFPIAVNRVNNNAITVDETIEFN